MIVTPVDKSMSSGWNDQELSPVTSEGGNAARAKDGVRRRARVTRGGGGTAAPRGAPEWPARAGATEYGLGGEEAREQVEEEKPPRAIGRSSRDNGLLKDGGAVR